MRERVEMRPRIAVEFAREIISGEARLSMWGTKIVRFYHVMHRRSWIIRTGNGVDGQGKRHGAPRLYERGGTADVFRFQVVQGALFVIGAPASPVRNALEKLVELSSREESRICFGSIH